MEIRYRLTFVKGGTLPATHEATGYYAFTELCRDRTGMGWLLLKVEIL